MKKAMARNLWVLLILAALGGGAVGAPNPTAPPPSGEALIEVATQSFGEDSAIVKHIRSQINSRSSAELPRALFFSLYGECLREATQKFLDASHDLFLSQSPDQGELEAAWQVLSPSSEDRGRRETFGHFRQLYAGNFSPRFEAQLQFADSLALEMPATLVRVYAKILEAQSTPQTSPADDAALRRQVYRYFLEATEILEPNYLWFILTKSVDKYLAEKPTPSEVIEASRLLARPNDKFATQVRWGHAHYTMQRVPALFTVRFIHFVITRAATRAKDEGAQTLEWLYQLTRLTQGYLKSLGELPTERHVTQNKDVFAHWPRLSDVWQVPHEVPRYTDPPTPPHLAAISELSKAVKDLLDPNFLAEQLIPQSSEDTPLSPSASFTLAERANALGASNQFQVRVLTRAITTAPNYETFSEAFRRLEQAGALEVARTIARTRLGEIQTWGPAMPALPHWLGGQSMDPSLLMVVDDPSIAADLLEEALSVSRDWRPSAMSVYVQEVGSKILEHRDASLGAILRLISVIQSRPVPDARRALERQASVRVIAETGHGLGRVESFRDLVFTKLLSLPAEHFADMKLRRETLKEISDGVASACHLAYKGEGHLSQGMCYAEIFQRLCYADSGGLDPVVAERLLALIHESRERDAYHAVSLSVATLPSTDLQKRLVNFVGAMADQTSDELPGNWLADGLRAVHGLSWFESAREGFVGCIKKVAMAGVRWRELRFRGDSH